MKVIRKDKDGLVSFGSLRVGDVFVEIYSDGKEYIQMKTSPIKDATDYHIYNAVCLESGEMYDMDDNTMVRLVTAEATIK